MNPYQLTAEQRDTEARRTALKPLEMRAYVIDHLDIGSRFRATHDAYNYQPNRGPQANSWREVVAYYPHCILAVDEYGKQETYQYYDVYELLRRQGG